jgi:uncharacterized membrane protein AbrB (regulator of aidB expression)
MLKEINQIFTIRFISVLIISFPSAIIADYFNIPLAWFLGPNDCHINCCIIRFKNHHA